MTYSYSISDSTDSELLKFSLFKCTDIPAAFEKASEIITEYASGKAEISPISLENAKASLAYQVISGRKSKLSECLLDVVCNLQCAVKMKPYMKTNTTNTISNRCSHSI